MFRLVALFHRGIESIHVDVDDRAVDCLCHAHLPGAVIKPHYIGMDAPDPSVDQFPNLERGIHADHAAISPWPRATLEAVRQFAQESTHQGVRAYPGWLARERRLRECVARMLNAASAADIALLQNTTEGVCIVANGIDWQEGDNVVTAAGEFPTNRLAWEALQQRGVQLRPVDIRAADDAESALIGSMDRRTRVLAVSSVQWQDGFRLQLDRLGRACRAAGALFFVDAIQEFGALQIDVRGSAIDCLAAGAHKWQMGPEGIALFYCRPEVRTRLDLARHGWHMLEKPYRFDLADRAPAATARRFEPGSPNMLGQAALSASLGVLNDAGMAEVERLVLANSRELAAGIDAIPGLGVVSITAPERLSGIVSFRHRKLDPPRLLERLGALGVTAAWRADAVRLSPHYYQHGAPLGRLLEAIETIVKQ
jgi:selenocysteine lyase/cysteine desulfurase